ncbi:Mus7/MMS22 family-domain-containing protein [Desarmillaria tabescens]|uniref:Mus7/MMS22 family-domain-containing protein n=1 Tax=Armillaria tabescens TaxID=1929756 RepID=A0AA39T670_ARMTA|nr:Mus7/MMS22 family-domain-containing protein [Desarmillaria tabescens]KAK0467246.1 Mus7/MMS22 family-domain-containing protein [Desarmillaria tabescens]
MTDEEVVETSDPEELEELASFARRAPLPPKITSNRKVHEESNGDSPPRKRTKLSHGSPVVAGPASVPGSLPQSSTLRPSPERLPSPPSPILPHISEEIQAADRTFGGHFEEEEDLGAGSEGSQDPLDFLHGYGRPSPGPATSSSEANQRLFSSSPLSLNVHRRPSTPPSPAVPKLTPHNSPEHPEFHATVSRSHRASASTPPRSTAIITGTSHDDYDDLFLFSPQKPRSPNMPSSPLTPTSSPGTNLSKPPRNDSSPSLPHSPSLIPPEEREALEREGFSLAQNESRYSFRTRSIRQVKPYEYDKALYQNQLRDNPDAIVKMRSPRRGDHHHKTREDQYEEETQDQEYVHTEHDRTKPRSRSPEHVSRLGLPDQLSSSDEEDKEIRATRREWKRVEKERKAREKREAAATNKGRREERTISPAVSRHTSVDIGADAPTPSSPHRDVRSLSPNRADPHLPSPPPHSPVSSRSSPALGFPDLFNDDNDPMPSNSYDTPIIIDDDPVGRVQSSASEPPPDRNTSPSGSDSEDDLNVEDRKRMKVLKRMYPAFMLGKFGKQNTTAKNRKSRRQSSTALSGSEAEEVNLLPGQSRSRITKQPRPNRQILGDSESSDDEPPIPKSESEKNDDDGNDIDDLPHIIDGGLFDFETVHAAPDVIEISDTSDEEVFYGDDNGHNDQRPSRQPTRRVILKEKDVIDCMLDGERRRPKKSRKRHLASSTGIQRSGRHRSSSVYHSATGHQSNGKKRERQTKLTFHRLAKRPSSRHNPVNDYQSSDSDVEFSNSGTYKEPRIQRIDTEKAAKEKKKTKGTRIANGSGKRSYNVSLNIDLTDEDFNNALAPSSQGGTDRRVFAPRKPSRDIPSAIDDPEPQIEISGSQHGSSHPDRPTKFPVDVPLLSQGISFARDTYVGKGWLFEESASLQICLFLIPDMDGDVTIKGWNGLARTASLQLSRQLHIGTESATLRAAVQDEISRLLAKTRTPEFIAASTEIPALNLCWLAVEWSVRLGFRLPQSLPLTLEDNNLLLKSMIRLVQCLAQYGLQNSMDSVPDSGPFETVTKRGKDSNNGLHPFWQIVEQDILSEPVGSTHLQVSEWIWSTVSSLCALSQFSVHGSTTSAPQAPAAWNIVTKALKTICLVENKDRDASLQEKSKAKRDQYIGTVVRRCFQLWSRCHWKLDDVSPTLTHLADVFRSRHFANLRHEESNFPGFMRNNDLSMLSQVQKHDSAFVLFLKLIVQFAHEIRPPDSSVLPVKVKKFLSLAVPVGTLAFSRRCPPSTNELSMLHNRHIATAIAIYLDPENHVSRIAHAQSYVKFDEADFGTRLVAMQALMHYSRFMVALKLPLAGVAEWLRTIVGIVVDEYDPAIDHKNDTVLPVQTVLRCVRRVLDVYNDPATRDYPEPELLLCIAKIVRNSKLRQENWIGGEIVGILARFFDARASVLPPPERPSVPSTIESQESQDEYGMFDLDMDDPDLLAALGEKDPSTICDFKSKDQALFKFLHEVSWIPYQLLKKLSSFPETKVIELDRCIMTWLGCASVVVRNGNDKNWEAYFKLLDAVVNHEGDAPWKYHVHLEGHCCMLQLDPMIYTKWNNKFFGAMLESLVPINVTIEHQFLSQILSIDRCQHPLFKDVPFQPKNDGDYHISEEDFLHLRAAFVKGIFSALNSRLLDQGLKNENELFIGHCIKLFSRMRSSRSSLEPGSESLHRYEAYCREVTLEFLQQPLLRSHKRLDYWSAWSRGIGSPGR